MEVVEIWFEGGSDWGWEKMECVWWGDGGVLVKVECGNKV